MQENSIDKLADNIFRSIYDFFGKKVDDFTVNVKSRDIKYPVFEIDFKYCRYYRVKFIFERRRFGFHIMAGEKPYSVLDLSKSLWSDDIDFESLLKELEYELDLRIPDKYLVAKGWKKSETDNSELVKALVINYLKANYQMNDKKAENAYMYLSQVPAVLNEFKDYIVSGAFVTDDKCVKVEGFSAEQLNKTTYLSPLGAFNYLVYLTNKPQEALADLKKGLPRK